jgi:hypothetical protein
MSGTEAAGRDVRILRTLIRSFFADYLQIVEPEAVGGLRLDQVAFRRMIPPDGRGLLAEVASRAEGEGVTVLVRIEPEMLMPGEISLRLGQSLRALRLPYAQPLLASAVYLQGGRPGLRLESGIVATACGIDMARLYFTTFGLAGTRAEHYLERPEPLAWALAARMQPTRRTPDEHARACLERIAGAALDEHRRTLLRRSVKAFLGALSPRGAPHP